MSKPLAQWIPSDDCPLTINKETGEKCYPHEGERVQMFVGMNVAEVQAINHLQQLGVQLQAAEGEPNEGARVIALLAPHFDELCDLLAERIVDWDWTNDLGKPLTKPDGTAGPLKRLRAEELYWLLQAAQGETGGQRKNGSRPSQTTSSATALPAMVGSKSTTGRNHTRG